MTESLEIADKKMHSIRYASECTGYSHDYLTRLAREGKIVATQVGRNWYVDVDSATQYASMMELEQRLRQQQLSEERKRELQLSEMLARQSQSGATRDVRSSVGRSAIVAMVAIVALSGIVTQRLASSVGTKVNMANVEQIQQLQGAPVVHNTESGEVEHLNFSHESWKLSTFGDDTKGVLLLPEKTSSTSPDAAKLFSDDVTVMTDAATGEKFVARLNDAGEVLEKIPFVIVPVNTSKTP